jgi:disulfide bond formation protein DsbB
MLETMLTLNWWVATGVLILEIALLGKLFGLLVTYLPDSNFKKKYIDLVFNTKESIAESFGTNILSEKLLVTFIFLFSLASSIMTLVYSEIFLQEPCALCWWQRVFMYGIVFLSGLPLLTSPYKGEENSAIVQRYQIKNILVFSIFGAMFALYQHLEQILALYGTHLPCPVSGVDCAKMTVFEYGHITFPWMAFVLFTFFIVIILLQNRLHLVLR